MQLVHVYPTRNGTVHAAWFGTDPNGHDAITRTFCGRDVPDAWTVTSTRRDLTCGTCSRSTDKAVAS